MATVAGIDVSYWNSGIDWPKVRATGQRFVLVKATEGETFTDPTFADNWATAKSAGLLRGAYCYFHPAMDAKKQAERFINTVKATGENGEFPPALDLEVSDSVPKQKIINRAKIWLDVVESALGRKPFIYSSLSFLEYNFSEIGGGPPAWAKDYPLWLAWYPDHFTAGMPPILPHGWFKWTVWQYSNKGRLNGINAKVDLDHFNGTLEDLYRFTGVQIPDPTPKIHTVAAGDSFESLANKYGVTVRELVCANPQLLKLGEKLTIPVAAAIPAEGGSSGDGASPAPTNKKYIVKPGDTLTAIAVKCGTTIPAIVSLNNLPNPNQINVGLELLIP